MIRNSQAVIGLGFGDEGKGKVTSYLCSQSPGSLVVRFSGGQQAGHHVVLESGRSHVFSNFGSGSLQGCHTYWSEFCTFDPVGFCNEWDILVQKGCAPDIYIDENCPITTPYEKIFNVRLEKLLRHGTCGVGVGKTWDRQEKHFSLKVRDLLYPSVLRIKLEVLKKQLYSSLDIEQELEEFYIACNKICDRAKIVDNIPLDYDNYIFEGSQGLLLDQDIGFFPHVTRSNVGLKNIHAMGFFPEPFLVTRAYQTRHGNGPMTNDTIPHCIEVNPYEQNPSDNMQGAFRRSLLDVDLLRYSIHGDFRIKPDKSTLVITCLDLIKEYKEYKLTSNGDVFCFDDEYSYISFIKEAVGINNVLGSSSPLSNQLIEI